MKCNDWWNNRLHQNSMKNAFSWMQSLGRKDSANNHKKKIDNKTGKCNSDNKIAHVSQRKNHPVRITDCSNPVNCLRK